MVECQRLLLCFGQIRYSTGNFEKVKKHHFVFEREILEIFQEFKYLGIIIKASGIFNKG